VKENTRNVYFRGLKFILFSIFTRVVMVYLMVLLDVLIESWITNF